MSGGDYTWDQMPEELAMLLATFAIDPSPARGAELQEWLQNEMQHCQASKEIWPRLSHFCPDLPVPGSEFCSKHMPKEDMDHDPAN